jgi:hypothetical protein
MSLKKGARPFFFLKKKKKINDASGLTGTFGQIVSRRAKQASPSDSTRLKLRFDKHRT